VSEREKSATDAALIERMERGVAAESDEESAARAPYQRLIERIGDLDVVEPPRAGSIARSSDGSGRRRARGGSRGSGRCGGGRASARSSPCSPRPR
jgi:hypothetical protein